MKILSFIKREPVLSASAALAAASMILVPPDTGYADYVNLSVLAVLFCLMLVVAGLSRSGIFGVMTEALSSRFRREKSLVTALCLICFFISALITNDVALITFVPFTLAMLRGSDEKTVIFAVVMETVAANLGSLITPVGNPQNLYLYTYFGLSPAEFFAITLPLGALSLALTLGTLLLPWGGEREVEPQTASAGLNKGMAAVCGVLFAVCMLTVLRLLPWPVMLAVVCAAALFMDRRLFLEADYILLLTFVCFFIFVGNAARVERISDAVFGVLAGKETFLSAALSQIISNVPAATMLSAFTDNARGLIVGTNIGGLGTLIASMASLISYRRVCSAGISQGRYIKTFSLINFALLALLGTLSYIFL